MNVTSTISTWTDIINQFFPIFTVQGAKIFVRLLEGWILCTVRRTVTGILSFADAIACLRRELCRERIKCMFGVSAVHDKKFDFLLEALTPTA